MMIKEMIKKLFKKEVKVSVDHIKIRGDFKKHPPKDWKLQRKFDYYLTNGEFDGKIVLNNDMFLIDGYCNYIIAKEFGLEKVVVEFAE